MATILFYRKPGCVTNARQMLALKAAGHDLIAKDMGCGGLATLLRQYADRILVQPSRASYQVGGH
ncbi:hypothetical protein J2R96_002367 [Bradyrhizobium elkanii]|nr:hypothetical protein [Bradyrhizobium elkanii]